MESLIDTFHIDWKLLIAQVINFAVVFILLYVYAIKPLMKKMGERSEKIEKGLKDADQNAQTLAQTQEAYRKAIAEAKGEAHAIIKQAKEEAEVKRGELLEQTKTELSALAQKSKEEIERERKAALESAKGEIADLVHRATTQVLGYAITAEVDREVVNKSLEDIRR